MAINLQVVADVPAELAPIWDQLRGDRAQVDIRDDDMFIVLDLRQPTDPTELLCDLAVATVVDDSGEEIEWVGCQLLKDHDGPHFHHEFGAYDDDGNLAGSGVDEPEPDSPLLDETTDPHEPERQAAQTDEPEPEPEPAAAAVVSIDQKARERHPATGDTLAARLLALFQSNPSEEFSPSDVADELGDATYGGVSSAIATLVRNGQVLRIGRGKYTAAS